MKKNDCIITIRGRVDLQLAYEGDGCDWEYAIISLYLLSVKNLTSTLYSAEMYTTWSAAIKFVSDDAQGLKVHVLPAKITPEFNNSICEGSLGHSTTRRCSSTSASTSRTQSTSVRSITN